MNIVAYCGPPPAASGLVAVPVLLVGIVGCLITSLTFWNLYLVSVAVYGPERAFLVVARPRGVVCRCLGYQLFDVAFVLSKFKDVSVTFWTFETKKET